MKKAFRIFSLLIISALYSFVIGLHGNRAFIARHTHPQTGSEARQYGSLISSGLLCHTAQAESSITLYNTASHAPFKNTFSESSASIRATEHLFSNSFSQYRFYFQNILVRLQSTDIIFPFHYFW